MKLRDEIEKLTDNLEKMRTSVIHAFEVIASDMYVLGERVKGLEAVKEEKADEPADEPE